MEDLNYNQKGRATDDIWNMCCVTSHGWSSLTLFMAAFPLIVDLPALLPFLPVCE